MSKTYDFGDGPVPAHKHPNGGGWVADTAGVSDTAYIGPDARVYGKALVYGKAQVYGEARVGGYAHVGGEAHVGGYALVYGKAQVYGEARVGGKAQVYGVMRSDGYAFSAVPCADGIVRVIAGCRYFTFDEARAHWTATRAGTQLGDETMAILDYMKRMVAIRGYA